MKNVILLISLFVAGMISIDASAQIKTPAPSPSAKIEQTVGMTDVHVEYSRPSMKGRTIFAADGLVPFGKRWRTGANQATKVTFTEDVQIEGKDLKKGSYALFSTPGASSWDVHFFEHTTNSAGGYDEATPALTATVTPETLPFEMESFEIFVGDLTANGATLNLLWSNVMVPMQLGVHTEKQAMASIDKTLAGPTDSDFYNAGVYMANSGKDLEKALGYIQKVTKGDNQKFWQLRQEAEVLAKLGKHKEAVTVAKKSMALATEAGNNDYIKINKDNIAKWMMK